jgi:hypothetical protein
MAGSGNPTPKPVDLNPRHLRTFPRRDLDSANFHRRPLVTGHDEDVIQMNGIRKSDSGAVQCEAASVVCMIGKCPRVPRGGKQEEATMLKTISAALVAVSILVAPALAGTPGKTAQAPVNKIAQVEQGKAKMLNANARMGRHHKHYRHHRHHKHIGLHKTHAKHIAIKHMTPAAKRS